MRISRTGITAACNRAKQRVSEIERRNHIWGSLDMYVADLIARTALAVHDEIMRVESTLETQS